LNENTPAEVINSLRSIYKKIITKPYQPTCENMLIEMVAAIGSRLPDGVQLYSVKLFETATSFAEWCVVDNG
ncbi:MAG TPA: 6-carboxytetrahydropterin synthase QueD, partial [Bacteroidetes bacterium]|nr:6-carboxytetrahydropterin synthase QueD [Bacteroidota bacterium]